VLAALAGPDGGQGVPVVRRGDGDGVDVAVIEDFAEVFFHLRRPLLAGVDGLQRVGDDVGIGVADGGDLDVLEGGEGADVVLAPAAHAEDGEAERFVGLVGGRGGGQGGQPGGGRGGGGEEAAAVERHGESAPGWWRAGCTRVYFGPAGMASAWSGADTFRP